MKQYWQPALFFITFLVFTCLTLLVDGRFIGIACCALIIALTNKPIPTRYLLGLAAVAVLSLNSWGALMVACLLMAILLGQFWYADLVAEKISAILSALLIIQSILTVHLPSWVSYLTPYPPAPALIISLATLCGVFFGVALQHKSRRNATPIDPLMSGIIGLLIMVLVLSIAVLANDIPYPIAILYCTLGALLLILLLFLLLTPFIKKSPFSNDALLSLVEHAFTLNMPVEPWIAQLSDIAHNTHSTQEFTQAAMQAFLTMTKIQGIRLTHDNQTNHVGEESKRQINLTFPSLTIQLSLKNRISIWQWLNFYLLCRILVEFYLTKKREEKKQHDSLIRATHETGARLTHDIKNILHTLSAMTQVRNSETILRQLPLLQKRLEITLQKLKKPEDTPNQPLTNMNNWWQDAQNRYAHQTIEFSGTPSGQCPKPLFDTALDNLLQNALYKQQTNPAIRLTVTACHCGFSVTDDGDAIPPAIAERLFHAPVDSKTGFGIGLYQVSVEAKKYHYHLQLTSNQNNKVVFTLSLKN